jgi:hypothetical protein
MINMTTKYGNVWKDLAANFVRDWGDIWNTDSEEHTGQTSVLAF